MASPTGIAIPPIQSGVKRRGSDTGAASPQTWTPQRPCFGAGFGGEKVRLLKKVELLGGIETMKDRYRFDIHSAECVSNLFFMR